MTFACAVCAHGEAIEVLSYDSYPAFLPPLPRPLARDVVRAPIALVACTRCGHLQVDRVDSEIQRLLYDVYYAHYEVDTLESMVPAYREPFQDLVRSVMDRAQSAGDAPARARRVLEIGCSSGAQIPFLTQFAEHYCGVDPSARIRLAQERFPQHTFQQAYFGQGIVEGPFEIAVTQFNLEHIPDVRAFVAALAGVVREDGVLFVQVPNAAYFIRTGQPNFVAHEHVHYFRLPQLALLLASNGFEVLEALEDGPSVILAARRAQTVPQAIEAPLEDVRVLQNLGRKAVTIPARPIFYGVGLTLHWLLAKDPSLADDATVVDDNPNYQGRGVPGYDLLIEAPSRELLSCRDVVLTLNAVYHERVRARLASLAPDARILVP